MWKNSGLIMSLLQQNNRIHCGNRLPNLLSENYMVLKILKRILLSLLAMLITALFLGAAYAGYFLYRNNISIGETTSTVPGAKLVRYVNPFIGTGGYPWMCAHNFPGPSVPFGVMRLSPDTWSTVFRKEAHNTSGYFYPDNRIMGFSHTRLVGTGAIDGGHFRIIPASGKYSWTDYLDRKYHPFRHKDEVAWPGYYSVKLSKSDILVELTAASRTGIHRYTFPEGKESLIMLDICSALGGKRAEEAKVSVDPQNGTLEGEVRTFGSFSGRYGGIKVYFFATVDRPVITSEFRSGETLLPDNLQGEGPQLGVILGFDTSSDGQPVEIRIAISHVSRENARLNLEQETTGKSFDELVAEASSRWEDKLSLIEIETDNEEDKTIFYTALYRSFQMPTEFQDMNGEYFGFDKQVHSSEGFAYYTDLSLWDTFRTLHPLYTLIAPDEQRDMLLSLVKMKEQGGWLPRWPSGNGYTNSMLGSPADIVISESYQKGIRDFDVLSAYEGMKEIALGPTPEGAPYSGRRGIKDCLECRYCPSDKMNQAVSRTLEYAWADYAISILADSLGFSEDAALFYSHSAWYKNTWNPETRYFHPRDSKGHFQETFKPLKLTYTDFRDKYTDDYVEGSALQWRFAVPFDPQGLIALFGGKEEFVKELDLFFAMARSTLGSWYPGSYYWHGNEPDIHAAFLFNEAGRPDLTQKWSRWILDKKYGVTATGLDGNDDGATLSSWYVFSSLGFYPIAGTDIYQIGAPLFRRAMVAVGENKLEVVAENFSSDNRYVKRVTLNGRELTDWKVRHKDLVAGGVLRFEMSSTPQAR
jgi:predicted alpha-1,2-mannosidase